MNVPWTYELKEGEKTNPAMYFEILELPEGFIYPTDEMLEQIMPGKNHRLQTWGRKPGEKVNDPHWIAVRGQTPLHRDPAYPRYSHHLKIRVDEGVAARGLDKQELELKRGLFYILDTHSPHQVTSKNKQAYNVAISIDSHEPIDPQKAINMCLEFGKNTDFLKREK